MFNTIPERFQGESGLRTRRSDGLWDYGIHCEESDYRVHVCFKGGFTYVYWRLDGVSVMGRYPVKPTYVAGRLTAKGHVVPWRSIPGVEKIRIPGDILGFVRCQRDDKVVEKGGDAFLVAMELFYRGLLVFPDAERSGRSFTEERNITRQMRGVDAFDANGNRIQVKCDYNGGDGGTGNLYLQIAEINIYGFK